MAMRMKPYVPSFSRIAARITEPTVGAWVWASGSQVWNGNIGTLMREADEQAGEDHELRAVGDAVAVCAAMYVHREALGRRS